MILIEFIEKRNIILKKGATLKLVNNCLGQIKSVVDKEEYFNKKNNVAL